MNLFAFRPISALLLAALIGVGSTACGRGADRVADSLHAAIPDSAHGPGTREGVWQGADGHSTWRATLADAAIIQLDEIALFADSTRSMRQFRFDSVGLMSMAHEERVQTIYGLHAEPDTVHTLVDLEWQGDSLVRSSKTVNRAAKLIQPYEVDNLRAHARELLILARRGASAQAPATPGR